MTTSPSHSRFGPPGPHYPLGYGDPTSFVRNRLRVLQDLARTYGDCCRFRLGFREVYLLTHPEFIRRLLVSEGRTARRSTVTSLTRVVLGGSVLSASGEDHQQQRKRLSPSFHSHRIHTYVDIIVEGARRLQQNWHDGDRIALSAETQHLALSIAGRALFNVDLEPDANRVRNALSVVFLGLNVLDHPLSWLTWIAPLSANFRIFRGILTLNSVVRRTIAVAHALPHPQHTLLGTLLEARDRGEINDRLVRDEVMLMMLASYLTTSQALTWTIYLIARHPDIQARLHAELDSVLGSAPAAWEALEHLTYTSMVIKEALRLYPPVPILHRRTDAPIDLGAYRIPAGRTVFVSPYITHRDKRFFPDPETFDPMRWADDRDAYGRADYFPFALGLRRCMGETFAVAEMTFAVVTLCQAWRLECVGGEPVEAEALVTLRPTREIALRVRRR